ncbi:MAG: tRNA (guanosine(46)-N7)-methyltransferase TrmB [Alphaproteobacteria bacterium]|nr:tRNA (guanosine(46)-N7)-methyltransferase TrmB [Alphaproteobacteria bacterium]
MMLLRSYGRKRSKYIRPYQQKLLNETLPDYRINLPDNMPMDLADYFGGKNYQSYALEIGFGDGAHLAWQAKQNPDCGFIGADPYILGVAKLLRHIDDKNLSNIRIFSDDIRYFLPFIPEASLHHIIILHPDPWPRKKHHKRRLIQPDFIDSLHHLLIDGGCLTIGTDSPCYMKWILCMMLAHTDLRWDFHKNLNGHQPQSWYEKPEIMTHYGEKAVEKGQDVWYFKFIKQ